MTTIDYNGQELECITEGYWPKGMKLICSNDGVRWNDSTFVCLRAGCGFRDNGTVSATWEYWAIKPAQRRLTNREVAKLCRAGWDACVCGTVSSAHEYSIHDENKEAEDTVLRAPGSDEWVEPTSDLLEVGQ